MRRYETIIIIRPNASEEDITGIIDRTQGIIEANGGSIVNIDKWGLKKLAYLINKEQQGYYVFIEYAGLPEAVNEMERIYRIDDRILKFMTIKTQDVFIPGPVEVKQSEDETPQESQEAQETVAAEEQ